MGKLQLVIGGQVYGVADIRKGNLVLENSLTSDSLSVDEGSATLETVRSVGTLFCPKGAPGGLLTNEGALFYVQPVALVARDISAFAYGRMVQVFDNGPLIASLYMDSYRRIGKSLYEITCVSAVGLLENEQHYGGVYSGITFEALVAEIVGDTVPFLVDASLAGIRLYGWLPIASKRDNLRLLLSATGISLKKVADGTVQFMAISDANTANIPDNRIYIGGSVEMDDQVNIVNVTEHTYKAFSTDTEITLFEGEAAASPLITPKGAHVNGFLVSFSGPMHDLTAEGTSILESGANYAVISGAAQGRLTGREYTHTTRVITRRKTASQGADKEISVTDNTLISAVNAENVATRLLNYYGAVTVSHTAIKVGTERPGDHVRFTDPFAETRTGFVKSLNINFSGVLKAETEIVSGFVPVGVGNYYEHRTLITSSTTFTVPADAKGKIRVVLIDPGVGGWSGLPGKQAEDGKNWSNKVPGWSAYSEGLAVAVGGDGGEPGAGGLGGRILILDLDVTPGQTFAVTIPRGGLGGAYNAGGSVAGSEPSGHTTFGPYSAADGQRSANGYVDPITGDVFGGSGQPGVAGGQGGGGTGETTESPEQYIQGPDVVGPDGTVYHAAPSAYLYQTQAAEGIRGATGKGAGGGAAVGGVAAEGVYGTVSVYKHSSGVIVARVSTGPGGTGATAVKPGKETRRGFGGPGGHGGGGAGGNGFAEVYDNGSGVTINKSITQGPKGVPGAGSDGGDAGDGAAIVLW